MNITIQSGFQRGGSLLQWDGTKFETIRRAGENTWHDDGDSSFSIVVPDSFRGAVVRFWGISALSYANDAQLIGFSDAELSSPSPVQGFFWDTGTMCRVDEPRRLETMGDYLSALARRCEIVSDADLVAGKGDRHPSGNGRTLVHLPTELGDQRADGWAVYSPDGRLETWICGGGDSTPEPVITDSGWDFTNPRTETEKAWKEEDERFYAAKDRGEADTTVAAHLRSSYAVGCNPLPTLRRRVGGTWTWEKQMKYPTEAESSAGVRLFTQFAVPDSELGYGWAVKHIPAK